MDIDEMTAKKVYRSVWLLVSLLVLVTTACGGGSPTGATDFAGERSGGSSQGPGITLTISREQKVTAITTNYTLNGCPINRTL